MSTTDNLQRNFDLRLAVLKAAGLVESARQLHEAAGWRRQYLWRLKSKPSPNLPTVSRLALLLGVPVEVLLAADPAVVSSYPTPAFDWLAEIEARRSELGFRLEDPRARVESVPSWQAFAAECKGGDDVCA